MPHPLRIARPADPFLRFHVEDDAVIDYAVDGDHVAFVRTGRRGDELWVSALGDDPDRLRALIERMTRRREIDGIHVKDGVYAHLPSDLQIPDPGHWSIWTLVASEADPRLSEWATDALSIATDDQRIDALLAQSSSAYLFAGNPAISRWVGVERGAELVSVGAETVIANGTPHLVSICTAREWRGRGLGRAVTAALASSALHRGAPEVYLEMYAGNEPAARLYSSLGFREVGRYRSGFLPGRARPQGA